MVGEYIIQPPMGSTMRRGGGGIVYVCDMSSPCPHRRGVGTSLPAPTFSQISPAPSPLLAGSWLGFAAST